MNNCGVDGWKERAVLREAGIPWKDVSTKRKGDEVVYTLIQKVYLWCITNDELGQRFTKRMMREEETMVQRQMCWQTSICRRLAGGGD